MDLLATDVPQTALFHDENTLLGHTCFGVLYTPQFLFKRGAAQPQGFQPALIKHLIK